MKTKSISKIRILALATLIGGCLAYADIASADELHHLITSHDTSPIMDPAFFKGVDTLVVSDDFGQNASKVLNLDHNDTRPTILEEVQKIFSDASQRLPVSWVSIRPMHQNHQMMEIKDLQQPNIMELGFTLSARQEMIAGKPVKVANLEMRVGKPSSGQDGGVVTTYPFIVPDTKEELQERIRDGVFYLTATLPNYFACGNKYGYQTKECPDCSLSSCGFHETWEERRK